MANDTTIDLRPKLSGVDKITAQLNKAVSAAAKIKPIDIPSNGGSRKTGSPQDLRALWGKSTPSAPKAIGEKNEAELKQYIANANIYAQDAVLSMSSFFKQVMDDAEAAQAELTKRGVKFTSMSELEAMWKKPRNPMSMPSTVLAPHATQPTPPPLPAGKQPPPIPHPTPPPLPRLPPPLPRLPPPLPPLLPHGSPEHVKKLSGLLKSAITEVAHHAGHA